MRLFKVSKNRAIISYICNRCQKTRMAMFPLSLDIKVDGRGLFEFVDTHKCKDDEVSANILFIDRENVVRSQVSISTEEKKDEKDAEKQALIATLAIPVPAKREFPKQSIIPDKRFKKFNIKEITVKDKLRQMIFSTDEEHSQVKEISVKSPLGFIEITANLTSLTDDKSATWWMDNIAKVLEEVVYVDEKVFAYLLSYVDNKIKRQVNETELIELEYICNSHIAIPTSSEETLEKYIKEGNTIFPNLAIFDSIYYKQILEECVNNDSITLFEIIGKISSKISISSFVSILHNLEKKSLIKLEKLQFFTVTDLMVE